MLRHSNVVIVMCAQTIPVTFIDFLHRLNSHRIHPNHILSRFESICGIADGIFSLQKLWFVSYYRPSWIKYWYTTIIFEAWWVENCSFFYSLLLRDNFFCLIATQNSSNFIVASLQFRLQNLLFFVIVFTQIVKIFSSLQ